MTTRRKKAERKGPAKAEKLALNKETIKDLSPRGSVKGGAMNTYAAGPQGAIC